MKKYYVTLVALFILVVSANAQTTEIQETVESDLNFNQLDVRIENDSTLIFTDLVTGCQNSRSYPNIKKFLRVISPVSLQNDDNPCNLIFVVCTKKDKKNKENEEVEVTSSISPIIVRCDQ